MPLFLLDTDICSYIIRERPASVKQRLTAVPIEQQCISVVTYAELVYGVRRSSSQRINQAVIEAFVRHLDVLDWTQGAADHYGDIRAVLETKGCPIGNMDMMSAAHARSLDATLVTNNLKHFRRVPKLKVERWT